MTAAVMLLPLIVGTLDEILLRQRHAPWKSGLVLAGLLFWQFLLSTEVLVLLALLIVVGIVVVSGVARVGIGHDL